MLPLLWLAVSPHKGVQIDSATVTELHLCFTTLLHHNEEVHVIAREHDFDTLHYKVSPPSTLTFIAFNESYVKSTFARAGITGGAHHSGVGGASKLLLPALFHRKNFIFFDTDIVFLNPPSLLMPIFDSMGQHHIIAAISSPDTLGLQERINSGVMLFKGVDHVRWVNAVIGALLLNPLNCDTFHWGKYSRPLCISGNNRVGGDQEVISVIVSATSTLMRLPAYAHTHMQGGISTVNDNVIALHYKRRNDARRVAEAHLKVNLSGF